LAGACDQGCGSIAIGSNAGRYDQENNAVAIGHHAASCGQNSCAIAIGNYAASNHAQGSGAIAIGACAVVCGYQQDHSIAIGVAAGASGQSYVSVAIGRSAASCGQGPSAVAIGHLTGALCQSQGAVAVGSYAARYCQSQYSTAIGYSAAKEWQQDYAVAIGAHAGQGYGSVYVSYVSGNGANTITVDNASNVYPGMAIIGAQYGDPTTDGTITVSSVDGNNVTFNAAMGNTAPVYGEIHFYGWQGQGAVAIGPYASANAQHPNSIVINTSMAGAQSVGANTTVIKTLRTVSGGSVPGGFSPVYYNNATGELIVVTP